MTIKGYADKAKTDAGAPDFATLNPIRESQYGLDVIAHSFTQLIGSDAAEAASTTRVIVATAHAALVGDVISWTSGTLNTREYRVSAVATNSITVSAPMYAAPSAADTFDILRQKAAVLTAGGGLSTAISNDANYGTVGNNTLRTAAQVGNATGAASFGTGVTGAQVLRAVTASRAKADLASYSHGGGAVTTSAYTQVIASTAAEINRLYIADTSGSILIVAVGGAGVEVDKLYLGPGHAGWIDLNIPASSRIAIKALDTNTAGGYFILTGLS